MHVTDAAILYASIGLKVFPAHGINKYGQCTCYRGKDCNDPGKHPIEKGWIKKATINQDAIRQAFNKYPFANIGIATGKDSNLTVLDVDGDEGRESLKKYNIPETAICLTGGGGEHHYFQYKKLKNAIKFAPGLDIRSDDGLVIAPPSKHSSGKNYVWSVDNDIEDFKPVPFPDEVATDAKKKEKKDKAKPIPEVISKGNRNGELFSIGGTFRNRVNDEETLFKILDPINQERCQPPVSDSELKKICRKLMQYAPKDLIPKAEENSEEFEPVNIADFFLHSNAYTLRRWRKDFYLYRNNHYEKMGDDYFESIIQSWMRKDQRFIKYIGKTKVQQIIKCFNQLEHIVSDEFDMNIRPGMIPLQNGIFSVEKFLKEENPMIDHDPEFLCTYCLPFEYNPKAKCETFDKIRIDILGNKKNAAVWDEVLGYHIHQINKLENFFILYGEGGNGKTVLLTILSALLGEKNISSVSLEALAFQPFALSETLGKLANIIPELPHIDRTNEGIIKAFATKEIMNFDRKWKPSINTRPTAVLTMATNTLPQFQDKSDGLWRRLILFEISHRIEEAKKDRRFITPEFWQASGELPGIFNRALEGLRRISVRGKIDETDAMIQRKKEYREELNAVLRFLRENCTHSPGSKTPTSWAYACFKTILKNEGHRYPPSQTSFVRQVNVEIERNKLPYTMYDKKIRIGDHVGRAWEDMQIDEFTLRRSKIQ